MDVIIVPGCIKSWLESTPTAKLPVSAAASYAPLPVEPPAANIISAPCSKQLNAISLPLAGSPQLPA